MEQKQHEDLKKKSVTKIDTDIHWFVKILADECKWSVYDRMSPKLNINAMLL